MFYDLGLSEGAGQLITDRNRASMATRLGYGTIAVAKTVKDRTTEAHRCRLQPIDPAVLMAATSSQLEGSAPGISVSTPPGQLSQLTRLNFTTAEAPLAAAALTASNPITASYDILAVQPLSERVLVQACSTLDVDLIVLDLSSRVGFPLRPATLSEAVKRGIHFEIAYAPALRDETSRRNLFSNAAALCRATRGKGMIVSSDARDAFELRGPYDVINIAVLFGLSEQHAKAAVSSNCASLLLHARQRRAYKGQILVELATMFDMDAKRKQPDKHIPKHAKQLCQKGRGQ